MEFYIENILKRIHQNIKFNYTIKIGGTENPTKSKKKSTTINYEKTCIFLNK